MSASRIPVLLVALLSAAGARAADRFPGPEVWVRAEHRGGEIVYHYELRNREGGRLDYFALGCDCAEPGQAVAGAQIGVLPAGTTAAGEDYRGDRLAVPPGRLGAPLGWQATVRAPPGGPRYWIEWRTFDPGAAIPPDRALAGFSLVVPAADPALLSGGYLVAGAATGQARAGQVRPVDTSPPRLAVELALEGTGGPEGTLSVTTRVSATDDLDPEPQVQLESFVREGPGKDEAGAGRLALTYRATDASGNTARETARATLPGGAARVVGLPQAAILP